MLIKMRKKRFSEGGGRIVNSRKTWVSAKCNSKMNTTSQSTNLSHFLILQNDSLWSRGTLISPAGTGLWEIYSFIYSNSQLKTKLTVLRTSRPKPEPDAFFCKDKYAGDTFCQPVIAEENFLFYWISCFYNGNLECICLGFHGNQT